MVKIHVEDSRRPVRPDALSEAGQNQIEHTAQSQVTKQGDKHGEGTDGVENKSVAGVAGHFGFKTN